jgi:hypothetical protein
MERCRPENYSGWEGKWAKHLPVLRQQHFYTINDDGIGGDAPKSFIRAYFYGQCRKSNRSNWTEYIAKVPYKWYPNESVTEYVIGQLGEVLGLNMAKTRLVLLKGEVRFLSAYFLKKGQELIHGAEIYGSYLDDSGFIKEIDKQKRETEFFTYQEAILALRHVFPEDAERIIYEFTKMLLFDSVLGNSDRHFYNWGVVRTLNGRRSPYFSPVYDSARGLFWNTAEAALHSRMQQNQLDKSYVQRYAVNSKPKLGWDGERDINHFKFVELLVSKHPEYSQLCSQLFRPAQLDLILQHLSNRFIGLFSPTRFAFIEALLKYRFEQLQLISTKF